MIGTLIEFDPQTGNNVVEDAKGRVSRDLSFLVRERCGTPQVATGDTVLIVDDVIYGRAITS